MHTWKKNTRIRQPSIGINKLGFLCCCFVFFYLVCLVFCVWLCLFVCFSAEARGGGRHKENFEEWVKFVSKFLFCGGFFCCCFVVIVVVGFVVFCFVLFSELRLHTFKMGP